MQDTARHDLRSPRHIPDPPCKVSRGVSTGTACYVIGRRTVNSLHDGALPVVVLFGCHGPHMQPVAYQCANLERLPPPPTHPIERRARGLVLFSFSLAVCVPCLSSFSFVSISSFARSISRFVRSFSLSFGARARSRRRNKKAGPSSMKHAIGGGERYFKPDERTDSRILSCETLFSKMSALEKICGTRVDVRATLSESFEVRLRGWFALSIRSIRRFRSAASDRPRVRTENLFARKIEVWHSRPTIFDTRQPIRLSD